MDAIFVFLSQCEVDSGEQRTKHEAKQYIMTATEKTSLSETDPALASVMSNPRSDNT